MTIDIVGVILDTKGVILYLDYFVHSNPNLPTTTSTVPCRNKGLLYIRLVKMIPLYVITSQDDPLYIITSPG